MPMVRVGRRVLFDPIQVKEWPARGGATAPRQQVPERPRLGRPRRIVR